MRRSPNNSCFARVINQVKLIRFLNWFLPASKNVWFQDARQRIEALDALTATEKQALYRNYCHDYNKYRVKFSEYYYGYDFPNLREKEKKEFISMRDLRILLQKYAFRYPRQRQVTDNKELFLQEFREFVHRKWMLVEEHTDINELQKFLDEMDVIVKPKDSFGGNGVYKLLRSQGRASDIMDGKLPVMVEECIRNVDELAQFHPASLNTIRVTTLTNGKEVKILGAAFRTGNHGSVFDNADSGGAFAEIDVSSGIIVSDGVTENGEVFELHPFSGKPFKGFQIPDWSNVISTCEKAALQMKQSFMIAWDVAITPNGIEIIEGNSTPTVELHQIPLHRGIKKKLYQQMQELHLGYKDAVILTTIMNAVKNIH